MVSSFRVSSSSSSSALLSLVVLASTALAQSDSNNSTSTQPSAATASTSTVVSALVFNLVIFAVEITIFLLLRAKFRVVYQPKSYLGPPDERSQPQNPSLFGWVMPWLKTPAITVFERQGLDAYMYLAFLWMMIEMFVPIWLLSWAVLMPVYAANSGGTSTGFNKFTMGNIGFTAQQQKRLAAPFLIQVFATAWILYCIRRTTKEFIYLRQKFLTSPKTIAQHQSRTILVTGIPNELLSERKLTQLYSHLPGGVVKVWLHRDVKELPDLVDERTKACNRLEAAETTVIKKAYKKVNKKKVPEGGLEDAEAAQDPINKYLIKKERPTHKLGKVPCMGEKVDSIEWCREEIARLNKLIGEKRAAIATDYKEYPPLNAAFILFKTQVAAHLAVNAQAHHEPYRMNERYMGAHPADVVWSNLNMNPYDKKIRTVIGWAITIGLVVFWVIPVGFVGVISNIKGLSEKVPFLSFLNLDALKVPVGIFQGILPTVMIAVLNMLLPIFLRLLARLSGVPTKTGIELSLMTRFFLFQIIQNFLFLTIVSGSAADVTKFANDLANNPTSFPGTIASAIPKGSTFFLSFIALQGLTGTASGFLRVAPLAVYYVKLYLLGSTPRKVWHINNDMGSLAWGTVFPTTTLITVITLGYMVIAPIVTGFAVVTFFLFWLLYKYQFIYVLDCRPETETAGLFFPKAVNQVFAGLYLEQVMLTALFFVSQSKVVNADGTDDSSSQSAIAQGALMVVLIVATAGFHYFLLDSFGSLNNSLPLTLVTDGFAPEITGTQANGIHELTEKEKLAGDASPSTAGGHAASGSADAEKAALHNATAPLPEHGSTATAGQQQPVPGSARYGHTSHTAQQENKESEETFMHPALLDEQKPIWLPDDKFGIGRAGVASARQHGVEATSEHTAVDEKGRVTTDADCPPGEIVD
ncbi:phosphate metabolism protein 7 [Tilletia horrida]|uniref:Phosphate metabolism protein 7 n=1 Tax=Tilletia horrida TaxID=155126 RepID=A0AAN6GB56_9BASI|nr:phosphate metabolism protein 7 [Tilletia horrida]